MYALIPPKITVCNRWWHCGTYTTLHYVLSNSFTVYANGIPGDSATVHVVAPGLNPLMFSYVWLMKPAILSVKPLLTSDTLNSIGVNTQGTYYVQVQWITCGGTSVFDTVPIYCVLNLHDTTICAGGTATLTAVPQIPGGTFLWAPGGQTTATITVSPSNHHLYCPGGRNIINDS